MSEVLAAWKKMFERLSVRMTVKMTSKNGITRTVGQQFGDSPNLVLKQLRVLVTPQ